MWPPGLNLGTGLLRACRIQMVVDLILIVDVKDRLAPVADGRKKRLLIVCGRHVSNLLVLREHANAGSQDLKLKEYLSATSLVLESDLSNLPNELVVDLVECIPQGFDE